MRDREVGIPPEQSLETAKAVKVKNNAVNIIQLEIKVMFIFIILTGKILKNSSLKKAFVTSYKPLFLFIFFLCISYQTYYYSSMLPGKMSSEGKKKKKNPQKWNQSMSHS